MKTLSEIKRISETPPGDRLCGVGTTSAYKKIELSQKTKQKQMLSTNQKQEKLVS